MSSGGVVGVRTARNRPLRFVRSADATVPIGTPVLVEHGGTPYLAIVAAPADLIQVVPEDAIGGTIVAIGLSSPLVANAVAALNLATLGEAQALGGSRVSILETTWSLDRARLEVTLDRPLTEGDLFELPSLRDTLAGHFKAEVRFRGSDGLGLVLPS